MAYCLHELAKNQDLQRRAHQEIDEFMKKYNGEITYDSMMDLKFLESCIDGKIDVLGVIDYLIRMLYVSRRNSQKIPNTTCDH